MWQKSTSNIESIDWTGSKLKISCFERQYWETEDNPQNGRKLLQIIYLLNNFLYKWPIITWKDAWHNLSLGTTTMRYHITRTRIAGIEKSDNNKNMEKLEPSYITSGNVKWHNHFGKQYRSFSNHKTWTNIRPSNSTPSYRKMQNVHRKNYILPLLLGFSTFPLLPPPSGLNTIMFSQRSLHITVSQHWIHPESLLCFQMLVLSTRLQQLEIRDCVWFILPPQW